MLQLGLESGDQGVLDAAGKGTRLEEIDAALAALSEASIAAYVYVLFGTPAEDRAAAERTLDFIEQRADRIACLNIAIFNLPASSADAARLETRPFYEGELSLYRDFRHPAGWDRLEVRRFLARELSSRRPLRDIVNRTPPQFSSNHAPFLVAAQRAGPRAGA